MTARRDSTAPFGAPGRAGGVDDERSRLRRQVGRRQIGPRAEIHIIGVDDDVRCAVGEHVPAFPLARGRIQRNDRAATCQRTGDGDDRLQARTGNDGNASMSGDLSREGADCALQLRAGEPVVTDARVGSARVQSGQHLADLRPSDIRVGTCIPGPHPTFRTCPPSGWAAAVRRGCPTPPAVSWSRSAAATASCACTSAASRRTTPPTSATPRRT